MPNLLDDLTGMNFGRLCVVERAPNDKFGAVYWRCVCTCGATKLVRRTQLRAGKFFTCGKPSCRFWEKVHVSEEADACWEWLGAMSYNGYGVVNVKGQTRRAHRVAWELEHACSVPAGYYVLHKCDNGKCVRPSHLFLGTHLENMKDMVAKNRQHTGPKPRVSRELILAALHSGKTQAQVAVEFDIDVRTVSRHAGSLALSGSEN